MSSQTLRKRHIGEVIGRLTLVTPIRVGTCVKSWDCLCSCGNSTRVSIANLSGKCHTSSCGCIRKESCRARERKKNHPTHCVVFNYYRRNAKVRKIEWCISTDQFSRLILGNCYYCGFSPPIHNIFRYGYSVSLVYNGIDRLDNSIGYTTENSVSCCKICNMSKTNMTVLEFLEWAKRLAKHQRFTL